MVLEVTDAMHSALSHDIPWVKRVLLFVREHACVIANDLLVLAVRLGSETRTGQIGAGEFILRLQEVEEE